MPGEPWVRERLMGLGHGDFLRIFPTAVRGLEWRREDNRFEVTDPPRVLEIHLGAEQQLRLGSLAVPQTPVKMVFHHFSEAERESFLRRFDLAFQRGGG